MKRAKSYIMGFIAVRILPWSLAAYTALILAGCSVGPDYVRPETPLSAAYHSKLNNEPTAGDMDPWAMATWWTTLNDPELTSLIERAVSGNLDLKKARARIREARASRGVAKAAFLPSIDASGSGSTNSSRAKGASAITNDLYDAGLDASWELDIFGGTRRSVEASQAALEAREEDMRDVLVSLMSETALNYIEMRTYQNRIAVAEVNLAAQSETSQLTQWRYEAGLSDGLAVQQARYNLESTRSAIPALRTGAEGAMNRIAVLIGAQPGTLHEELKQLLPMPAASLEIAVGVPADALRRRPDVRRAERELAAQTAKVGVATAELYPKLTLSGSIGLEALTLSDLIDAPVRLASRALQLTIPVFHGGAIRQNIKVQSALQEQYLIAYEATVLGAVEEAENAIVAYAEEQLRRQSLSDATQAAKKAADLARYKYEAGLTDFSDVLEAQRSLFSFQDQLVQSNGTVTSNLVRLYKAIGGGWESLAAVEKD